MSRPRSFSLLEVMVAMGLSLLMVGAVALFAQQALRIRGDVTAKVDRRMELAWVLERLRQDGAAALAVPTLAEPFGATRLDQVLSGGSSTRADRLDLVVLAGDPPRLERVRWSLSWDSEEELGYLWRETWPVAAASLPGAASVLASTAAPARDLLLRRVTLFAVRPAGQDGARVDPPRAGEPPLAQALVSAGRAGPIRHRCLAGVPPDAFRGVASGTLVFLRDDRTDGPAGLEEGLYRLLDFQAGAGVAVFGARVGWADQVAYRVARIPPRLSLQVALEGGPNEEAVVALADSASAVLAEGARNALKEAPP